jgi:hypothetical protein
MLLHIFLHRLFSVCLLDKEKRKTLLHKTLSLLLHIVKTVHDFLGHWKFMFNLTILKPLVEDKTRSKTKTNA